MSEQPPVGPNLLLEQQQRSLTLRLRRSTAAAARVAGEAATAKDYNGCKWWGCRGRGSSRPPRNDVIFRAASGSQAQRCPAGAVGKWCAGGIYKRLRRAAHVPASVPTRSATR